ncbi:hypothetical protein MPTK1_6g13980 [Marchantia polymorpha subsp. ruderalis]|uniref:Secreted protein n=2 Tax=Marchantia polymorpha TaxID=3197 RepID=A0AAF6BRU4_MARPO|nr:hypothetical protein MARPO_0047s0054 [Marchantia polymorpha]BBN14728.1 hypothetical protein Mp_6g13980 [Marchantia polymorpha subsp. ruderalis]|eukprot:PTQ39072.1 hypothetical protein MARPO_0047s0054 [Marchantia polymorpha]
MCRQNTRPILLSVAIMLLSTIARPRLQCSTPLPAFALSKQFLGSHLSVLQKYVDSNVAFAMESAEDGGNSVSGFQRQLLLAFAAGCIFKSMLVVCLHAQAQSSVHFTVRSQVLEKQRLLLVATCVGASQYGSKSSDSDSASI